MATGATLAQVIAAAAGKMDAVNKAAQEEASRVAKEHASKQKALQDKAAKGGKK